MTSRCRLLIAGAVLVAHGARAEPPITVEVRARPGATSAGAVTIGGEEGRRMAGTQDDAIKSVQTLPGVGRGGAGDGELVVWGAAPSETHAYVDGVEIPVVYHGSGVRSVLPSGLVRTLSLVPGAYAADHGRGTGGLLSIATRPLDLEGRRYELHADLLDAGVTASVPLAPGTAAGAGFRHSLVDRWAPRVSDDATRLLTLPRYMDGHLRATWRRSEREQLDLTYLASNDASTRTLPTIDPSRSTRETAAIGFHRLAVRYRSTGAAEVEVTPFVGLDHDERAAHMSAAGWRLRQRSAIYGLRARHTARLAPAIALALGMDSLGRVTDVERSGTLTLPAREGDARVFGQPPAGDVAYDGYRSHVLGVAPYAEASLALGAWRFVPGLRLETTLIETSATSAQSGSVPPIGRSDAGVALEPRLTASYAASDRIAVLGAAGVFHAPPNAADLSAVFGNPSLGSSRAEHVSIGERFTLGSGTRVEITSYAKRLEGIAVRDPSPTPRVGRALVSTGQGRVFGVELLIRQTLRSGWAGWLAWTASRSERRAGPGQRWRRFDFDQPHAVALTLARQLASWSFGARARYASGTPRTPVVGASYNLQAARFEPVFGAVNDARLPAFFQLDLRVDRRFELTERAELRLYADFMNVTFRRNAEEVVYSEDFRQREYFTGLPPLVVLGASLRE